MIFYLKIFFAILVPIQILIGNDITNDAPKILLKDVDFNISFTGSFNVDDSFSLNSSGKTYYPFDVNSQKIKFKDINTNVLGNTSFSLEKNSVTIHELKKYVIRPWVSILPPLIAIALAFLTRSIVPSLFVAIWFGSWAVNGLTFGGIFTGLLDSFNVFILNTILDRDHAIIALFTLMLGGMVGIIYRNGGMHGIIQLLIKKANTPKKGQISIWLFGVIIFFDDYSNTLIVGNTSRLLCDKLGISREKLAYLVDSTSAPVATVAVITTWIGFQISIISDSIESIGGISESAYLLFIHSIAYSFYPFLALFLVGLVVTTGKDFGPMVEAELQARKNKNKKIVKSEQNNGEELKVKDDISYNAVNAILPISVLVISMFYFIFSSGQGDTIKDILGSADTFSALMHSTLLSAFVAAILSVGQRILSLNETFEAWYNGLKFMLMGLLVLVLAWALADISKELHTADYIVSVLGDKIPIQILPTVVFFIAAITAFGSGSSWGVMAILMPLVIPLCWAVMENYGGPGPENIHILYSTIACVLTGAVWADHCSPISDTTILTSMASGCDLMDHVKTQMPYALIAGSTALFAGTLPAGFGVPWWILLGFGFVILFIIINTYGKSTDV
tara:strand:- start:774 stop:2630 length:1857 start_codon:yes stop_codon:yes gene_type:complete